MVRVTIPKGGFFMNDHAYFKRIIFLSASVTLLASCGSENETEEVEAPVEQSTEETAESVEEQSESVDQQSEETDNSNNNQVEEATDTDDESSEETASQESTDTADSQKTSEESQEQSDNQKETALSKEEAVERVMEYAEETDGFDLEGYQFMATDADNLYKVQMFKFVPEDAEVQEMRTAKWYDVDKQTGEVTSGMDRFSKDYMSEVVSMSEEERESYHRSLAAYEEDLSEKVFDQLLLPGVHENTTYYEGRVGSDKHVRLEYPGSEDILNRKSLDPTVDEEGYFYIDMSKFNLKAEESFILRITGGYPLEQVFELPVYEAQEGMEEIHVRE